MTYQYCINEFLGRFPEHKNTYEENIDNYHGNNGEILAHVFFGDFINIPLFELLEKNIDTKLIEKYIDFLEFMLSSKETSDPSLRDDIYNVLSVTVMAYLGDNDVVLKNAFTYFSEGLMIVSKEIEEIWRRRKIIISYRRGNVYGRW